MSFPLYPRYKDSGVEWLGQVPEHWRVVPLGRVTISRCDGPFGSGLKSEHYRASGVRVIRLQNIRSDGFDGTDEAFIDAGYYERELGGHDVKGGDVLIAGLGDDNNTVGRACVAPVGIEPAMVKADCFRYRLDAAQVKSEFVAAALSASAAVDAGRLSSGSTRSRIPLSVMATRRLGIPPLHEQAIITNFLRREVRKIDDLIAEQQRLTYLLKEKRQAVISRVVTKGLNPEAPMKPSGAEWLGDIPEHWIVTPLKWLTDPQRPIMYGIVLPGPDVGEGIPILKGGNVKPSRMNLQSMARTTPEIEAPYARARLKEGDLVYSIRGSIGDCELVPADLEGSNITQDVARVAIAKDFCPSWARWSLLATAIREDLASGSFGAAVRGINIFDLKRASIPTPPLDEQEAIARFIDGETAKLEQLSSEAQRAIDLLQERRTALISAVVTGQIDVRGIVEKAAA